MKIPPFHRLVAVLAAAIPLAVAGQALPYLDPNLSPEERAADLCSRLTLEEKSKLMMNASSPIPRLGIPEWEWWSEALHGVGRAGLSTVFPSCIGMAASFDDALIEEVFSAVSDEARAKNTAFRAKGDRTRYHGLSFWTPNINVFRDPRWGRGQETYGEDPFMNGRMGLRVVRGLQGDPESRYAKLLACAKHYAVHSGPEKTRHRFDISDLPQRELWETYLPAFKTLVQDGKVSEVMCAYQRFEGEPCCGSDKLLNSILRYDWGFDGIVVSDCGAISDFYRKGCHEVSPDAPAAVAKAVHAGTDVECGSEYRKISEAVRRGDLSEADLDVSLKRLLKGRFLVGDFDPDSLVSWTSIPLSVVNSERHKALARKMGREQMVLLKNNGILPLKGSEKIMVMGPNATDSTMLWGIYYGQPGHTVTMLEGLRARFGESLPYHPGCMVTRPVYEQSIMNEFVTPNGIPGMAATYWNDIRREDPNPVTTVYTGGITLDTGGNTAFHPGVNLNDFTATYVGKFTAKADEELHIIYNNDDGLRIIINGDTIHNRWHAESLNFRNRMWNVKAGETYTVQIDYMQLDGDGTLNFDVRRPMPTSPAQALAAAADADVILFIGGISPTYEREEARVKEPGFDNGDRTSIEFPQPQRDIIAALKEAGKKVVLVNCSGSAVALTPEEERCDAILQAWYAGEQGGHALADVLTGDYNPSGKLPVTFYRDDSQLPPFDDYLMRDRTYRYFRGEPLYPFGYGLSYTTFALGAPEYADGTVVVDVTNTGDHEGTEVVQVYVRRDADTEGPTMALRGYERVTLAPGQTKRVSIPMPEGSFETFDEDAGEMRVVPGAHTLFVGTSSSKSDLQSLSVVI